jgi:hypothetical protein
VDTLRFECEASAIFGEKSAKVMFRNIFSPYLTYPLDRECAIRLLETPDDAASFVRDKIAREAGFQDITFCKPVTETNIPAAFGWRVTGNRPPRSRTRCLWKHASRRVGKLCARRSRPARARGFFGQPDRFQTMELPTTLMPACNRSDAFPVHCALSAIISRTRAATGSASRMFSIASRRLFE